MELTAETIVRVYGQDWVIVSYNEALDMYVARQLGRHFTCLIPVDCQAL